MPAARSSSHSRDGRDHLTSAKLLQRLKMFSLRRYSLGLSHPMSRWPVLLFCSALVIFIFVYKLIGFNEEGDKLERFSQPEDNSLRWTHENAFAVRGLEQDAKNGTRPNQLLMLAEPSRRTNSPRVRSAPKTDSSADHIQLSTVRWSPARDHRRQAGVLILVLPEEDSARGAHWSGGPISRLYPNSAIRVDTTRNSRGSHKFATPAHIVQLMDVLTYHRIDFTLNLMLATGLPSDILQNPKRFSVIILDDFIKYSRLNRWARDQLDRFCRSNQIGVITYLIDSGKLDYRQAASETRDSFGGEVSLKPPNVATKTERHENMDTTKVTAEQYPLSFELTKLDCGRNQTPTSCLVDYQLSDKTTVLRILKTKPDFIVKGDLKKNLAISSVVTLVSNHATHEPLTWARIRQAKVDSKNVDPQLGLGKTRTIQKRAVLPAADSASSGDVADEATSEQYPDEVQTEESSEDLNDAGDDQSSQQQDSSAQLDDLSDRKIIAMLDNGLYDGIRRVIFGLSHHHWLNRLLLLDVIEYLSSGNILTPLERYIQIDIDDIFVGATGTRLNASDVLALVEAQKQFGSFVQGGFKFNLGFSGKYYLRGNEAEQAGDKLLIANSEQFTWFCHFWSHSKAHLFNTTEALSSELIRNLKFAEENQLTLIGNQRATSRSDERAGDEPRMGPTYAVAPHHSGVYPIHEQLYEAWRSLLNVQVTSTEEYPHLRPAARRGGFAHKTIKVLPRQTCGLYTHTIFRDKYPGGFARMLASIKGGELFETIVHNPVNIYMTHMSNYANDRLALFTFKTLFEFVTANTNLQLTYSAATGSETSGHERTTGGGPVFLADYYFGLYPDELQPLWTNPCDDKRHLAIWSAEKLKLCASVPKLLIVGPQKTGTTALWSFLKLNPSIRTSSLDSEDFEEVQFFNDKHYSMGTDWYLERFHDERAQRQRRPGQLLFVDKSATYFDDPKVPRRASSLLPDANIVILLINPADRAHSWYQHIRAHGDPVANEFSFDEMIMFQERATDEVAPGLHSINASNSAGPPQAQAERQSLTARQLAGLKSLRNRCLHPGYYSNHLLKWLEYYPSRQIIIVDGEWFRLNPVAVLDRLQLLLRLPEQVDYEKLLVFHEPKGFYCERPSPRSSVKCLGNGKGRKYGPMSVQARDYLDSHYLSHNRQLARLLYEIGQPLPSWLDRSINRLPPTTAQLL